MKHKMIEIFLFIDALGWKIVNDHDFLADLLPYRKKIDMQFGYSSSAIPTILSGKTPAVHGHLGLFRFAPDASPFKLISRLSWLFKPASFWNRGRVRHHLSKLLKKAYVLEAQLQTLVFVLPKYLDVIAVAKIYEYLKSGRCTQLNGSNGAYRVYDTEMRNNHFPQDSTDARATQMDFQREYTIFSLMSDVSSAYSDLTLKTDQLIYETIHNREMNEVDSYRESVEAYYSLAEEKLNTSEEFLREHKKQ